MLPTVSGAARSCAIALVLACTANAELKNVQWTGWFSDSKCAYARAASGTVTATNPDCAKTCIEQGATAVFIGENAKAVYEVRDYPPVVSDLGYHVEIVATVDETAKTVSIHKVTRLAYEGASCSRTGRSKGRH